MSHGSDLRLTKRVLSPRSVYGKIQTRVGKQFCCLLNNLSCNRFNDKQNKFIQQIVRNKRYDFDAYRMFRLLNFLYVWLVH